MQVGSVEMKKRKAARAICQPQNGRGEGMGAHSAA